MVVIVALGEPSFVSMGFGYCGIIAAACLFLSPAPTCRRICNVKAIESFSPLPYIAQFVESSWWAFWAIAAGDRFEMLLNNVIGATMMLACISIFARFVQRERTAVVYAQILMALALVGCALMVAVLVDNPGTIFGVSAVSLNCIKYASPLSVARLVIRTQSVEFMPLPLTLASLACGVFWGAHGFFLLDAYIWAPNSAGVLFSVLQVVLYVRYAKCGDQEDNSTGGELHSETAGENAAEVKHEQAEEGTLGMSVMVAAGDNVAI